LAEETKKNCIVRGAAEVSYVASSK